MKASESAQKGAEDWSYVLNFGGCYEGDAVADLAADFTQAEARGREQMAAAVRKAMQDGYPEPPTKGDECEHGKFGWEDCIACYDTALEAAILSLISGEPA